MFKTIKQVFQRRAEQQRVEDFWIFAGMLAGSVLSLIASLVLSIEAVQLAANPNAALSCSINVIINCATVALHPSANLFGFPNAFLGLIAEPVVMTVAIAGLSGIRFPRRFMFTAQIFYTLGFIFAYYLLYMSYAVIGALCPWCLLVTVTTTLVFFSITRYNILHENLYLPKKVSKQLQAFVHKNFDILVMVLLIVAVTFAILIKYRDALFM